MDRRAKRQGIDRENSVVKGESPTGETTSSAVPRIAAVRKTRARLGSRGKRTLSARFPAYILRATDAIDTAIFTKGGIVSIDKEKQK